MSDLRRCNRCGIVYQFGVCPNCSSPEFTLMRDPQMKLGPIAAALLLVLLAGCVEEQAAPKPPAGLTAKERAEIGAQMALAVVQQPAPPAPEPDPEPAPQPGDVCPDCNGKGKVSRDGRVWSTCLPCRGTGVVQAEQTGDAGPPKTRTVYRKVCDPKTGTCKLIPETEIIP
jgi:hypothetical protein